jgi:hypothetical protein
MMMMMMICLGVKGHNVEKETTKYSRDDAR